VRDATAVRPMEKPQPATAGELERITEVLYDALRTSGYVRQDTAASAHEKVRRLVRRLHLQAGDAEVWLGMLRQIAWKLRSGGSQVGARLSPEE
jgi:tRNA C32,U32 (ribose-2'-O)-methylase TrmJ